MSVFLGQRPPSRFMFLFRILIKVLLVAFVAAVYLFLRSSGKPHAPGPPSPRVIYHMDVQKGVDGGTN